MKRRSISLFAVLFAVTSGASLSHAQSSHATLHLAPVTGWYKPLHRVGSVSQGDTAVQVGIESSVVLGVGLGVELPRLPVTLRGQLAYAPSAGLSGSRLSGSESCGTNCTRLLHEESQLAPGSMLLASGNVQLRIPHVPLVRPYLMTGVGVRRHVVERESLRGDLADAFSDSQTGLAFHFGLGFDFSIKSLDLNAEVGDYVSRYRLVQLPAVHPASTRQHDLSATIGLRVGLPSGRSPVRNAHPR